MVSGLGTRKAGQLIERMRSPRAIFQASVSDLEAEGLSGAVARSIASGCAFEEAVEQQQKMLDCGASLIPISGENYPARLREIFDPPILLFVRGRVELLESIQVSIVGTRRPTPYGLAVAERLAADLATAGVTITSGMARGIDTAAHKGALGANAPTIAVFGCGVDMIYPAENRRLADQIAANGLLVSEFPMGSAAYPQNFPIRNRIVSGMSAGVLVIEGAQYSGSAITARLAMEQGREVFAVPGNITSKMSWGPNLLIKQGAKIVQDWNDVVVELPAADRLRLVEATRLRLGIENGAATSGPAQASLHLGGLSDGARAVLDVLKVDTAMHLDELLEVMERSSSEIIAALFELEMSGLAKQLPGRNFVKVW